MKIALQRIHWTASRLDQYGVPKADVIISAGNPVPDSVPADVQAQWLASGLVAEAATMPKPEPFKMSSPHGIDGDAGAMRLRYFESPAKFEARSSLKSKHLGS